MFAYILKRLLLMVPTLLGVLTITFMVIQFVPGGPVEQYMAEAKAGLAGSGGAESGALSYRGAQGVDAKRLEQIKALYGFDKPPLERFWRHAGAVRPLRPGQQFFPEQGCRRAHHRKIAGVDHAGFVDVFHQLRHCRSLGRGQGGACRFAVRLSSPR